MHLAFLAFISSAAAIVLYPRPAAWPVPTPQQLAYGGGISALVHFSAFRARFHPNYLLLHARARSFPHPTPSPLCAVRHGHFYARRRPRVHRGELERLRPRLHHLLQRLQPRVLQPHGPQRVPVGGLHAGDWRHVRGDHRKARLRPLAVAHQGGAAQRRALHVPRAGGRQRAAAVCGRAERRQHWARLLLFADEQLLPQHLWAQHAAAVNPAAGPGQRDASRVRGPLHRADDGAVDPVWAAAGNLAGRRVRRPVRPRVRPVQGVAQRGKRGGL